MRVKFWGTRGSIATPGQDTVKYGGNTSCVEVSDDQTLVIFDAGTGIRPLGLDLLKRFPDGKRIHGHIFISHFHLDHIQGFPFFVPVYKQGNSFTIYGCEGAGKKLENIFVGQMSPEYFPVTLKEMPAELRFMQLTTRPVEVNGWKIHPTYVNHPGLALGYRLDTGSAKVAYITDNEPFRYLLRQQGNLDPLYDDLDRGQVVLEREDKNLVEFIRGVDILIHDAQYTIDEYKVKLSWGHSFYEFAIEMALQAEVKQLVLFHHDPMRPDRQLDELLAKCKAVVAKRNSKMVVNAAWEGLEIRLADNRK
ncbi:MAG: MBL fold metallo-hydrolase [Elusimicrobia bacterium]|nr:MBL fold metallo-hydrolase [Elusimicrobiota bacterium]